MWVTDFIAATCHRETAALAATLTLGCPDFKDFKGVLQRAAVYIDISHNATLEQLFKQMADGKDEVTKLTMIRIFGR